MEPNQIKLSVHVDTLSEIVGWLWYIVNTSRTGLEPEKQLVDVEWDRIHSILHKKRLGRAVGGRQGLVDFHYEITEEQLEQVEKYVNGILTNAESISSMNTLQEHLLSNKELFESKRKKLHEVLWLDFTRELSLRKLLGE